MPNFKTSFKSVKKESFSSTLHLEKSTENGNKAKINPNLPVGSSPKRIQGIGLNPVVCENVNRMRETRDPQFHSM